MADQGAEGILSPFLRAKRVSAALPWISGRVLDIGCGSGHLANYLPANGYVGFDVDEASLEIAKKKFPGYRFEKRVPDDEMFDTIVALAVIEHVPDPENYLRQWRRHLVSGGSIVLTTPHPAFDWIHDLGAKVGLFSGHANEEHEELIGYRRMQDICEQLDMTLSTHHRFLFGANQLFILT